MKKIISYISASLVAAIVIVFIVSKTSFAETVTATSVEQQLGRLSTALEKLLLEQKTELPNPQTLSAVSQNIKNPTCLDNYKTWKTSNTYKSTAQWNVDFMPYTGSTSNGGEMPYKDYLTDINGDGLSDYIFTERADMHYNSMTPGGSCVYLNTGSGFTSVYKCYATYDNGTYYYYGDCAG